MIVKQIIAEAIEHDILLFTQDGKLGFKQKSKKMFPDSLKHKIKENKDDLITYLVSLEAMQTDIPVRDSSLQQIPLSNAQQRLWFIDSLKKGSAEYNQPVAFNIKGEIDISLIEKVINKIVERHEILRTTYHQGENGPYQKVNLPKPFEISCIDITDQWDLEKKAAQIMAEEANLCFDLSRDLMLRVKFIHMNQSRDPNQAQGILLFNMHHIASDGWSQEVLIKEFVALYNGYHKKLPIELAPLEIQYADFALWQKENHKQDEMSRSLAYWQKQLSDAPTIHSLPLSKARPQLKQHEGGQVKGALTGKIAKSLLALAHNLQLTPFMLTHALVSLLLSRHSNSNDIVIGTPVANRVNEQLAPLIGFFVNTLPLRVNTEYQCLDSYLKHVKQVHLCAQEHQSVQFDQIVEHLDIERSGQYSPLCQIMLTTSSEFGVNQTQNLSLPGINLQQIAPSRIVAKFDLDIHISIDEFGVELNWLYDKSLFDETFIHTLNQHLSMLFSQVSEIAKPDVNLIELQLLTDIEHNDILNLGYGKLLPQTNKICMHELIEGHAQSQPDAVAIETYDRRTTYAELNSKANQIAHWMQSLNIEAGQLVGLCMSKSADVVASMLAVWKLGAAYIPLDSKQPSKRLKQIIEDANPTLVICDDTTLNLNLPHSVTFKSSKLKNINNNFHRICSPDDLAYVIYTSGSTGKPKGVMISHQAFINFSLSEQDTLDYDKSSFIFNPLTLSFDAGNGFLWAPLASGGAVYLETNIETGLSTHFDTIETKGLTHAVFSASMINEQEIRAVSSLKYLISGGSEINQAVINKLGNTKLVNCYGPTETTVTATSAIITAQCDVSIGRASCNYQTLVLGKQLELLPLGAPGELYIGGVGLAKGYLNQPNMTAERFIDNPYYDKTNPASSKRLYRTGDLVRYLPNGNLSFIGRVDDQVKIRGFRIELGEIANQLCQQDEIDSALVLAKNAPSGKYLVAYIRPVSMCDAAEELNVTQQMLSKLALQLPDYMVPNIALLVQDWPLTSNGKINKEKLPQPDVNKLQGKYIAPESEAELAVVAVCAALLGLDAQAISIKSNFFNLGGHSLLLMQLASELRQQGFEVDAQSLFSAKTIQDMAEGLCKQETQERLHKSLIPEGCETLKPEMVPLVSLSEEELAEIAIHFPGKAANIQDIYPLAPLQEGVLFVHSMNENNDPYVTNFVYELKSQAALDTLIDSLKFLLARHDVLRTAILWRGRSQALQVVQRSVELPISWHTTAQGQSAKEAILALASGPQWLDIEKAPLLGLQICQDKKTGYYYAQLQTHHLIVDHVSMEVIQQELAVLSQGELDSLAPPASYREFIADTLASVEKLDVPGFFSENLGSINEPTLPYGLIDTLGDGSDIKELKVSLNSQLSNTIRTFAKTHQVSPAAIFHAAWAIVVCACSGQKDVVFGTVLTGRMNGRSGIERLLGMLINTLPLSVHVGQQNPISFITEVDSQLNALLPYEQVSLAEAQKYSGLSSDVPLFSAMLNYRHSSKSTQTDDLNIEEDIIPLTSQERTNYPFNLSVNDFGSEHPYSLDLQISKSVEIQRVANYVLTALTQLVSNKGSVNQLSVLPEEEQQKLLVDLAQPKIENDRLATIPQRFEHFAKIQPDAIALSLQGQHITYDELNREANRLAHYLINEQGVLPDTLIGLCCERSIEMVIAILAILKAGGAYVPLDPQFPLERITYMIEDAGLELVLNHGLKQQLTSNQLEISHLRADLTANLDSNPEIVNLTANNLAYVIYTSGSTGRPKGVLTPHKAVKRLITEPNFMALNEQTVFLHSANIAFDAATIELWGPLLNGGRCVLYPNHFIDLAELNHLITQEQINSMWLTAGLFSQWSHSCADASCLRYVLAGGDIVHSADVIRVQEALPQVTVINGYGPTENTTFSCCYAIEKLNENQNIPIGKPLNGDQALVLDHELKLVPYGGIGELCIGGNGLARGYLNHNELTLERFIENPYKTNKDSVNRLYRTGDLVRYLPDGNLTFIGRMDDQIKIRGFRIELGEIVHQFNLQQNIDSAVVLAKESTAGKYLIAYLKPKGKVNDKFTEQALIDLANCLPDYMVPSIAVEIEDWPLTSNGKIDKKALPEPNIASLPDEFIKPENDVEAQLRVIWSKLLDLPENKISTKANFFNLGGHSLLSVRLASEIRAQLAVEMPVKTLFHANTIQKQAKALNDNKSSILRQKITQVERIKLAEANAELLPVSFAQQRLWFIDKLQGGSTEYNMPAAFNVKGCLDLNLVEKVLNTIIERHEVLRTVYRDGEQGGEQIICRSGKFKLVRHDVSQLDMPEQQKAISDYMQTFLQTPFDLTQDLMVKGGYIHTSQTSGVLLFNMHHIASDGWSMQLLVKEFVNLYQAYHLGKANPLTPLAIQYGDYAHWQRNYLQGEVIENQLEYWRQQLSEMPVIHNLPLDFKRPEIKQHQGAIVKGKLNSHVAKQLTLLAKKHELTPFMLLHSALALLLSRHSNSSDIVIGTPVANRLQAELEPLIGFFVNTLVLRVNTEFQNLGEYFNHVKEVHLGAQSNQDVPFEQLVEDLKVSRSTAQTPLFQIMLTTQTDYGLTQEVSDSAWSLNGVELHPLQSETLVAKFDLDIKMIMNEQGITLDWTYDTSLFSEAHINTLNEHLCRLLEGLSSLDLNTSATQLPILSKQEQQHLLVELNNPRNENDMATLIHKQFEYHAKINPDAIAISIKGHKITYGDLNKNANQLAHHLINNEQIKADSLIGLCSERSIEMVIAILAILKSGGAYVPLDPSYPIERLSYMVEDAGLDLILNDGNALEMGSKQLNIATLLDELIESDDSNPTVENLSADNLAYVIYTSGSTGKPKGVMTPHKAVLRLICEPHFMSLNQKTVFLHSANIAFDAATIELWGPLLNGGRCVLYPNQYIDVEQLNSVINQEQVNSMWLTAGLFSEWSQNCGGLSSLLYVLAGGDVVQGADVYRVQQALPQVTVINGYGPTENTTFSCCYAIPTLSQTEEIPIGQPLNGDQALILDQQLNLVPYGSVGELCVGGDGLARGYLNQPKLTQERFIENPFKDSADPNSANRLYRTGDLVRYLDDGNLAFIGRLDEQVKIRGFRVELGEIAHQLNLQESIDSSLLITKNGPGGKYLVAYIKPVDHCEASQHNQFIVKALNKLSNDLPDYMVPSLAAVVNDWPLTVNGKIDRKQLPEVDVKQLQGQFVSPENEIETQLCEIWAQLLDHNAENLSTHAHFFEIGGNSLLVVRLATLVRERFNIEFEIKELYNATRICDQAIHIEYLQLKSDSSKQDEDLEEQEW